MQVILDSSFARLGSAPIWGGKKGEFRDWTSQYVDRHMNLKFMRRVREREPAIRQFVIVKNKLMSVFTASVMLLIMNFVITLSSTRRFDNVMTKFMINNRNKEYRGRNRHNVECLLRRCTIFRLAKPAFFRYSVNFTSDVFYVAYV